MHKIVRLTIVAMMATVSGMSYDVKDQQFDPNGYYPFQSKEERMEAFPEASFKTILLEIERKDYRWAQYHLYFLQYTSPQDEITAKLMRLYIAVKTGNKDMQEYWSDSIEDSIRDSYLD